jgi:WD40 repeat protein
MRFALAFLLPALCGAEGLARDASWNGRVVDLSRLELLRSFGPWKTSALSPAGQALGVYVGNSVAIVDVKTGRRSLNLDGHDAPMHDSGWSRDGRTFATTGYDGKVRFWEVATGRCLGVVAPHAGYACSVALSSDGRLAATGGSADAFVKLFETAGGREIRSIGTRGGATYTLGFSGDSRYLVGMQADGQMRTWRVADGVEVASIAPKGGYVHTSAFSRDGRWLAYPSLNGAVLLADTAEWSEPGADPSRPRRVRSFEGHPGGAGYLAFHPAGRHFASSGADGGVRVWELATGKRVLNLAPNAGASPRVAFSADGQHLIVAGADDVVRVFGAK